MITTADDVRTYVLATLDGRDAEYDVDGIVSDLRDSSYWPVPDRPVGTLDAMPTYWDVVQSNERTER